ncbi:MAG: hypothetical protein KC983_06835 [Phycisphaerales bacterium]|nr:hypothetical protein [Phycisphaerales bacterium]
MTGRSRHTTAWMISAVAFVAAVACALHFGGNLGNELVFDEKYITVPIHDLIERGWSVETAIDYTETKGPTMIWTYALFGQFFGESIQRLRAASVLFFILGVIPLLLIARKTGLTGVQSMIVAGLYIVLPMNAVLAQMVMSEASFIFGALWLMWSFLWGFGRTAREERRIIGAIVFGVILAILLYSRLHAVAFAGAAALVSLERDRARCWPWWVACVVAGLLRIPLVVRWGGFVAPAYQFSHTAGLSATSMTYLAAAMVPFTGIFLLAWWFDATSRRQGLKIILIGAGVGLLLGVFATPLPSDVIPWDGRDLVRFQGFTASLLSAITDRLDGGSMMYAGMMMCMSTLGAASLAALMHRAWRDPIDDRRGQVNRLFALTILTGWGVYLLTDGQVFDRYLLPWSILAPITWVLLLGTPLLILQAVQLTAFFVAYVRSWL